MLTHPNPRYLVSDNVIPLLQAFLDTGGKSRADIKHHATEIKDIIRCIHLPNSEAKCLLLGLLANLIDGSSLSRGFISAMTEAGLIPTGEIAYVGGIYPNGEVFHKRNREAQLAHDVQLLEGNVEHRTKPIKRKTRTQDDLAAKRVTSTIEVWEKKNLRNGRLVVKPPSFKEFCRLAGEPASADKGGTEAWKAARKHRNTLSDDYKRQNHAPVTARRIG
jgi:hypothetical protein